MQTFFSWFFFFSGSVLAGNWGHCLLSRCGWEFRLSINSCPRVGGVSGVGIWVLIRFSVDASLTALLRSPLMLWDYVVGRLHYHQVGMKFPIPYCAFPNTALTGKLDTSFIAWPGWKAGLLTRSLLMWEGPWLFSWCSLEQNSVCSVSQKKELPLFWSFGWTESRPLLGFFCLVGFYLYLLVFPGCYFFLAQSLR
jgi:hypothetical protein